MTNIYGYGRAEQKRGRDFLRFINPCLALPLLGQEGVGMNEHPFL